MWLHSTIFFNLRQNRCFRRFCCKTCILPSFIWFRSVILLLFSSKLLFLSFSLGCLDPRMHYAMIALSNFFCHFRQNRWALSSFSSSMLESLDPLMPHAIVLSNFLKIFCQNCFFLYFLWGLWTLSCLMPLHSTIFWNFRQNCYFCQFRWPLPIICNFDHFCNRMQSWTYLLVQNCCFLFPSLTQVKTLSFLKASPTIVRVGY